MFSKDNTTLSGLIFIFLFVFQQIISFIFLPYTYYPLYRILIIIITISIGFTLPLLRKRYQTPFIFLLVCIIGSFLTYFNGNSIGNCVSKSLYAIIGYIGFVYVSEKKINLRLFDFSIIIIYIFFFFSYFSLDEYARHVIDGNLFGMSSSNTIAITLNIVLLIYFLLSKNLNRNNKIPITVFAVTNLILIIIQGSRAGIMVALIISIIAINDLLNVRSNHTSLFVISFIVVIAISIYFDKLSEIMEIDRMQGLKALEEDVRGTAQRSFFGNMDFPKFLLGYPPHTEFTFDITRTFNAYLDFWNKYGFIPFIFLFILLIKRIIQYKSFNISLIYFIPLFFYSFVESLWGGNFWDILIYLILFYSYKENVQRK